MAAQPGTGSGRDFVTIFKTGSVDRSEYPELTDLLLDGRNQLTTETSYLVNRLGVKP